MRIILLRHGESWANVAHVINDDPKRCVNLTEKGRLQAEAVAMQLQGINFTHAYASEFPRARQTAEIVLRDRPVRLGIDARLNERISGMDGLPVEVFNDLVRPDPLNVKPGQGESFLQQMERLKSFLDEIAKRHEGGLILAVSHENPILAALALTVADPAQAVRGSVANCEWLEMDWPAT